MRCLIDTCVILDFLQSTRRDHLEATKLMTALGNGTFVGYVSAKSLCDIYYYLNKGKSGPNLPDYDCRQIIFSFLKFLIVVDTLSLDSINALTSPTSDYEDGILIETAVREHMDYIITQNIRDFKKSSITTLKPYDFLTAINVTI